MSDKKKIDICVFQVNCLGDFVAALPTLRALRMLPHIGRVSLVTSNVGRDLVSPLGLVDEVVAFDFVRYQRLVQSPLLFFEVIRKLRSLKLDATICVDDECSMSALLAWCSGAKVRFGFDRIKTKLDFLYNQVVGFDREQHVVHNRLRAVVALSSFFGTDAAIEAERVPLKVTRESTAFVDHVATQMGCEDFVVIHPFAKLAYREWPLKRFRCLVDWVLDSYPKMGCLVLGDQQDVAWTIDSKRFRWVARTTLDELVAMIDRAALFVGNNSGPMNIAMNQGTLTIGINGPSARWWRDPWDDGTITMINPKSDCVECELWGKNLGVCECSEYMACLKSISVESVCAAMMRLLKS